MLDAPTLRRGELFVYEVYCMLHCNHCRRQHGAYNLHDLSVSLLVGMSKIPSARWLSALTNNTRTGTVNSKQVDTLHLPVEYGELTEVMQLDWVHYLVYLLH